MKPSDSHKLNIKRSVGEVAFDTLNVLGMLLFCVAAIYPFLYLISLSVSSPEISFARIQIIPSKFSAIGYMKVFYSRHIWRGIYNTIARTVLGTLLTIIITSMLAYPLSKRYFPNRNFWTGFIVFTMFFSGGLIPTYLLVKALGLVNRIWALILPMLVPTFSMIIMRNFFMTIPEEMEESAKIDGANEFVILFRIIIPLSLPVMATVVLWTAVGHWNAWFDCMIYIRDIKKQVMQVILRRIVMEGYQEALDFEDDLYDPSTEIIKAATIVVTMLPILLLYPFLQRYFVKGILIGALKG